MDGQAATITASTSQDQAPSLAADRSLLVVMGVTSDGQSGCPDSFAVVSLLDSATVTVGAVAALLEVSATSALNGVSALEREMVSIKDGR